MRTRESKGEAGCLGDIDLHIDNLNCNFTVLVNLFAYLEEDTPIGTFQGAFLWIQEALGAQLLEIKADLTELKEISAGRPREMGVQS